jgi:hypothetical protein
MTNDTDSIFTDSNGDVTITAPTAASNGAAAHPPGLVEVPEFVVYMHEGRPVLYKRYEEK